jgi:hypothetical protein
MSKEFQHLFAGTPIVFVVLPFGNRNKLFFLYLNSDIYHSVLVDAGILSFTIRWVG